MGIAVGVDVGSGAQAPPRMLPVVSWPISLFTMIVMSSDARGSRTVRAGDVGIQDLQVGQGCRHIGARLLQQGAHSHDLLHGRRVGGE